MIIYATKKTIDRFDLTTHEDFSEVFEHNIAETVFKAEQGESLLEWGAKIFCFDGRKCIQIYNFASQLRLILIDVKTDTVDNIGDMIAFYMMEVYSESKEMKKLLKKYFEESSVVCFAKLTDRSIVSKLNTFELYYLEGGNRLYDYIENGILKSIELNRFINAKYPARERVDGKINFFMPAERFEELLKKHLKEHKE